MPQTLNSQQKAMAWLERFAQAVDADPEIIDAMPIEDVRAELTALGADGKGFHARLARTLKTNPVGEFLANVKAWFSPLWEPQWAGQAVTAADVPVQEQQFTLEDGGIAITCFWNARTENEAAYIKIAWTADISPGPELWVRFAHPETQAILYDGRLGTDLAGEETFTAAVLGFDPTVQRWAITLIVREPASRKG